jgi:hypothetical protein
LSNPPFGVVWGGKDGYEAEARKLEKTRYQAGMPAIDHGELLFLQTMLAKMIPPADGGSRIAITYGRDYFEATGKKTTNLACTNATKVGEFPIPLPPLIEQEVICVHLDEKLGELKGLVTGIESQIATLNAYRKSLIHECVTGQRRITEADLAATKRIATA